MYTVDRTPHKATSHIVHGCESPSAQQPQHGTQRAGALGAVLWLLRTWALTPMHDVRCGFVGRTVHGVHVLPGIFYLYRVGKFEKNAHNKVGDARPPRRAAARARHPAHTAQRDTSLLSPHAGGARGKSLLTDCFDVRRATRDEHRGSMSTNLHMLAPARGRRSERKNKPCKA